nr:putative ribonuclease H-like domain-containing protein [Tanacetum cinerariifolium]
CARFQVTPKTSHLHAVKRIFIYLNGQPKLGLWYPRDSPFDLEAYFDSDYARANLDRKSTTGEYVAVASCYGQVLWIQNQMLNYGFNLMNTNIYIENESTICIVKNQVFHSKTKHIEIRHHFIRDSYEKKLIQVIKIHTDHNVTDLLTKAFDIVYKEWEDRMERAATTPSSLEAEQDSGNINRTQSIGILNKPLPQGTGSGSGPRQSEMVRKRIERISELKNRKRDVGIKNRQECGEKPSKSEGFEQIMDSLNAKSIRYALTVNPTVYASCVKQFWTTAKLKKVNGQEQIQDLVDKQKVLDLEEAKTGQAKKIANLKKRVKKVEKRRKSRPAGLKRLKKVSLSKKVESSKEKDSLGAQEDASKQMRSIEYIDQDAEIALVDEAQGRMHDAYMFGVDDLEGNEVIVDVREIIIEKEISTVDPITTADKVVTAASVEDSVAPNTTTTANVDDDLTLANTLIAIKAAKPKVISTIAITVITAITTPRAKGIVFHEQVQSHIPTVSSSKDKGKAKMIEPEKTLKKKDQISLDEKVARKLEAEMKAEMEETTAKVKKVNGQEHIQALVDKQKVLDLEEAKTAQAKEIANLKKRVKKLEKRRKSRPAGLRRLKKMRSIEYVDQDAEIALVDEAQGRMHDADMFGVDDLEGNEVIVDVREIIIEKEISTVDPVTTADKVVTAASVEDSASPTTATTTNVDDDLTLENTLIAIKAAKPKVISTIAIIVITAITTPRAKDVRLQVDYELEIAYDLLRLIRRQINKGYKPE